MALSLLNRHFIWWINTLCHVSSSCLGKKFRTTFWIHFQPGDGVLKVYQHYLCLCLTFFFFLLLLFFCLTPSPILLYFISLYFISVSMPNLFFSKGSVEINKQAKWGENSVRFCLFLLSTKNICFFWEAISLVYYKHHCLPVRDNAYNLAFLSTFVDLLNLFAKKLLFWGESTGLI